MPIPAEKPRIVRQKVRWTMHELADWLGVHHTTIYKIMKNRNRSCPVKIAERMERLTGISRVHWVWPDLFGDAWAFVLESEDMPEGYEDEAPPEDDGGLDENE